MMVMCTALSIKYKEAYTVKMKLGKRLLAVCLVLVCLVSLAVSANAASIPSGVQCYHGNDNTAKKCYAKTTQNSNTYNIGAHISWQLTGSSDVEWGDRESSPGASVTSSSPSLRGKSGQSFGYFYVNSQEVHHSTAWMNFSF